MIEIVDWIYMIVNSFYSRDSGVGSIIFKRIVSGTPLFNTIACQVDFSIAFYFILQAITFNHPSLVTFFLFIVISSIFFSFVIITSNTNCFLLNRFFFLRSSEYTAIVKNQKVSFKTKDTAV